MSNAPALSAAIFPRSNGPTAAETARAFAQSRERVLLTLLALDLMLMAFFVVLNSTATFDQKRTAAIAQSLQPVRPQPAPEVASDASKHAAARGVAAAALRAAVADVFAPFLSGDGVTLGVEGRVDVEISEAVLGADGQLPDALGTGLASIIAAPSPGYHTELVVRAQTHGEDDVAAARDELAHLADDLVARGVVPTALSVGTLAASDAAAPPRKLRFSFFLVEPDEEPALRVAAGAGP